MANTRAVKHIPFILPGKRDINVNKLLGSEWNALQSKKQLCDSASEEK